jgi:RNA-directed DNA polymerase
MRPILGRWQPAQKAVELRDTPPGAHKTIRKRMRAKLRETKQQLRQRMHDPVRQTGQWLKSVVQAHFNYSAVPGNPTSLSVFRNRGLALWWRTVRRRSQKHRINWTRTVVLATRWLPETRALHPFPDVPSPPLIRDKNRMRQ